MGAPLGASTSLPHSTCERRSRRTITRELHNIRTDRRCRRAIPLHQHGAIRRRNGETVRIAARRLLPDDAKGNVLSNSRGKRKDRRRGRAWTMSHQVLVRTCPSRVGMGPDPGLGLVVPSQRQLELVRASLRCVYVAMPHFTLTSAETSYLTSEKGMSEISRRCFRK